MVVAVAAVTEVRIVKSSCVVSCSYSSYFNFQSFCRYHSNAQEKSREFGKPDICCNGYPSPPPPPPPSPQVANLQATPGTPVTPILGIPATPTTPATRTVGSPASRRTSILLLSPSVALLTPAQVHLAHSSISKHFTSKRTTLRHSLD
jgi:hypothetical protein